MPKDCSDCTLCRINRVLVLNSQPSKPLPLPSSAESTTIIIPKPQTRMPRSSSRKMNFLQPATPWPSDRALRVVSVFTWIPAFSFLLPFGVETDKVLPALGIIPMSFGAVLGVAHILGVAKYRIINMGLDLILAIFMMAILIPSWVQMSDSYCISRWCSNDTGMIMLASYGTMMMMINFCIHAWFVLREIPYKQCLGWRMETCPHCQGDLSGESLLRRVASYRSHESYHSLQQQQEEEGEQAPVSAISMRDMEEGLVLPEKEKLVKQSFDDDDDIRDESQSLM